MTPQHPSLPSPEALARWLPGQRWFGAKTRRIEGVVVADTVPLGSGVVLLVDVELDGGGRERYAMAVLPGEEIRDALGDGQFCRGLVEVLARGDVVTGERGEACGVPAAGLAERWPDGVPADLTARRIGGEQSNTSIVVGGAFVLKLIRKLAEGINPEAEITRFLTARTAFRNAPRLAGHLEYRDARGATTTFGILQGLVPDAVDGWQWVLARLGEPSGGRVAVEALRRLGQRTGELHVALASDPTDSAFAPEPISSADVAAWTDAVLAQLAAARAALGGEGIDVDGRSIGAGLSHLVGRQKIRHHGDFHLGQTLYQPALGDWTIIDFEGEPLRPLAERRRKHAALRDVAGMLRSFDYAAVSAAGAAMPPGPWADEAGRTFLEGYRGATGGARFLPASDAGFDAVVAVFELEKAAYEIVYEANNRPDWIGIPRRGLLDAAARLRRRAAGAA
jgi:maltose alpha-D-glucosyltransferase/alpha-amylase